MSVVGPLSRFACILHGTGCFKSKERDGDKERARETEKENVKNQIFIQLPILNVNWISRK